VVIWSNMSNLKGSYDRSMSVLCKHCGSARIRKYGFVEGLQTYYCNDCKRKFRADDRLFRMKTPYLQVASALEDYFFGNSINNIRDSFNLKYGSTPPSSKTVYGWITKFTDEAVIYFNDYHPRVGPVWIASETIAAVSGKHYGCLDIVDRDTHFLIATQLSVNRGTIDMKNLLVQAVDGAKNLPDQVLIDRWSGSTEGIDLVYESDSKRIVVRLIGEIDRKEFLEYWHPVVESRTRILERLKSAVTASKFLDSFRIWYNYLRPQEFLNVQTPAEKADIVYSSKSWGEILQAIKPQIQVSKPAGERKFIPF
jgi:transposase-like protein